MSHAVLPKKYIRSPLLFGKLNKKLISKES